MRRYARFLDSNSSEYCESSVLPTMRALFERPAPGLYNRGRSFSQEHREMRAGMRRSS